MKTTRLLAAMLLAAGLLQLPVAHAVSAAVAKPPAPPIVIEIAVDFDGTIGWNNEIVKDRADLESRLYRLTLMPDQPEVHLEPNKLAPYKYVAEVMAEAQRLGVTKIGIVGNEQFTH